MVPLNLLKLCCHRHWGSALNLWKQLLEIAGSKRSVLRKAVALIGKVRPVAQGATWLIRIGIATHEARWKDYHSASSHLGARCIKRNLLMWACHRRCSCSKNMKRIDNQWTWFRWVHDGSCVSASCFQHQPTSSSSQGWTESGISTWNRWIDQEYHVFLGSSSDIY